MSKTEAFLTQEEEQEIVDAICVAEKNTSGEIRVHLEKTTALDPYLAAQDKTFVICGDQGINDVVANDFWDSTKDAMVAHFKKGNFKQGLVDGILIAGEQLKKHFPWSEDDTNELSNEISKGE